MSFFDSFKILVGILFGPVVLLLFSGDIKFTSKNILINDYQHQSFLYQQKFCKHHFFYGAKNNKLQKWDIQTFIDHLIYFGTRKVFPKSMQHMFFKDWFPVWFNMR